jgi:prolyl-tRNA synthetase
VIYLHRDKNIAINEEVIDDAVKELGIARDELEAVKTAEVGNIFNFGSQKTDEMGLYYTDKQGKQQSLYIGSYGIGVTRVMGVIVEKMSDDKGIIWPENIAPYKVYLVSIGEKGSQKADELYEELKAKGVEVLYDDRDERPGAKFADAELLGIPYRVTVSDRGVEAGEYEYTVRATGETKKMPYEQLARIIDKPSI